MVTDGAVFGGQGRINITQFKREGDGMLRQCRVKETARSVKDVLSGSLFYRVTAAFTDADRQINKAVFGVTIRHCKVIHPYGPHADTGHGEGLYLRSRSTDRFTERTHIHNPVQIAGILDVEVGHSFPLTC